MITDNLEVIKQNSKGYDYTLIAVSKKQPDNRIDEALKCGLRNFGENRVQEASARWTQRKKCYDDLILHLIGPLQTNKVKKAVKLFDVIHTLDREKLAREITTHKPDIPCFIQVNIGNEPQKAGITIDDISLFYNYCLHDLGMNIIGLMCIPPIDDHSPTHFNTLAELAKISGLPALSMGMSEDYPLALRSGATHIRIGSKLFGERI